MRNEDMRSAWLISRSTAYDWGTGGTLGPFKLGEASPASDVWSYVDAPGAALWHQGILCRIRPDVSGALLTLELLGRRSGFWQSIAVKALRPGATRDPATWMPTEIAQLTQFGVTGPFTSWLTLIRSRRLRPVLAGARPVAALEVSHAWPVPRWLTDFGAPGSTVGDWPMDLEPPCSGAIPLGRPLRVARLQGLAEAAAFDRQRLASLLADLALAPADPEVPAAALALIAATGSAPRSRVWRSLDPQKLVPLSHRPPVLKIGVWVEKLLAAAELSPSRIPALATAAALWVRHGEASPGPPPDELLVAALTASLADPTRAALAAELAGPEAATLALTLRAAIALAAMHPAQPPGAAARSWVSLLLGRPWQGGWLSAERSDSCAPAQPTSGPVTAAAVNGAVDPPLSAGSLLAEVCKHQRHALQDALARTLPEPDSGQEQGPDPQDEPEGIHDMRVAVRRLTTAMALIETPGGKKACNRLGRLGRKLGDLRDGDVMLDIAVELACQLELPARADLVPVIAALATRRRQARDRAASALGGKLYRKALAALSQVEHETPAVCWPVAAHMAQLLEERAARLPRLEPTGASPEELHVLRLAIKSLRYAIECFEPALPARAHEAAKNLGAIQTLLGRHHDLCVLNSLIADVPVGPHEAADRVVALARAELEAIERDLPGRLAPLQDPKWLAALLESGKPRRASRT